MVNKVNVILPCTYVCKCNSFSVHVYVHSLFKLHLHECLIGRQDCVTNGNHLHREELHGFQEAIGRKRAQ